MNDLSDKTLLMVTEARNEILEEHNLKMFYALQDIMNIIKEGENKYEIINDIDELVESTLYDMGLL